MTHAHHDHPDDPELSHLKDLLEKNLLSQDDFSTFGENSYTLFADMGGYIFADGSQQFNDIAADTSTTATAVIGGTVSGTLEVSLDNDWFRIELTAGQRYNIALDGAGANALEDPLVRILDNNGNQLGLNDDGGPGRYSLLGYTAEYTGTHYISAQAWIDGSGASSTGDYELTVSEAAPITERDIDGVAHFLTDEYSSRKAFASTTISYDVSSLSTGAQALAIQALEAWADVAPFNFVSDTSGSADITFQDTASGAYASYSTSGGNIVGATVNVSSSWNGGNTNLDSYTYQTYIHEIGHALGLGHGGPYNGSATYGVDNIYLNDSWAYTVMSYFDQAESGYGSFRLVLGPQIADIVAIQDLYGVNTSARNGNTVYGFNSTETDVHDFSQFTRAPSLSIYDTGGTDTLDFSGYSQTQDINLNAETFSDVNGLNGVISIARDTIIENAIGGSGIDTITGNDASNTLTGNAGNDILDGGDGIDYAAYNLASISDYTVVENPDGSFTVTANSGNEGSDTLTNIEYLKINGVDYALGSVVNLTELADNYTGTENDDIVNGLAGNDVIEGAGGNDRLDGGNGVDTLLGGDGDDTILTGFKADIVDGGDGIDTVDYSMSDYAHIISLASNVNINGHANGDQLTNIENVLGSNTRKDDITGNLLDNLLDGQGGKDVLRGGKGDDTLKGGVDDDSLFGGKGADVHDGGDGRDWAKYNGSSEFVNVDLINGGTAGIALGDTYISIENVRGTDFDDTILTNNDDNKIIAGKGNDIVDGRGGDDALQGNDGNDTLSGGTGNDTLKGQAGNDVFVFSAGDDVDKVLDFDDNGDDRIDLSDFGFTSFADVQAIMSQIGSRVSIDFGGGDVLRLENTDLADMGADDFILSGGAAELPSAPKTVPNELPVLNQDLIAEFMADNAVQSPIYLTRADGILEIMTDDDMVNDWDGFAVL